LQADIDVQGAAMIPNKRFTDNLDRHELEALAAFDNGARYLALEWHRRARKTTLAINLLIRECCRNPKSKFVYVAPTQVWARNIVWDDPTMIWDAMPLKDEIGWKSNDQKMLITFGNGSMLKICGSDEPDAVRGIDASGVVFDEWALHKVAIWTQIFRPIIAGDPIPGATHARWAMFLYTPKGINHATMMFNNAACVESEGELPTRGKAAQFKPEWFASRLIADESGIIARAELDKMLAEVADGTLTQAEYDQEMQCRRVTDEERTLITSAILDRLTDAFQLRPEMQGFVYRIVAIDPAFGGDICSIKGFENNDIKFEKNVHFTLTSEVCAEAKIMAQQLGTKNFIVDCIGNGKGVADGLATDEANYNVQYFNSSEKATDEAMFANMKAEAVYWVAQKIRKCEVWPIKSLETRRQLIALSRYKIQPASGKMIMRPNDEVKKDIGCSPDQGLCYIYGIWGLQKVQRGREMEATLSKTAEEPSAYVQGFCRRA
jgi:hypothetical protein